MTVRHEAAGTLSFWRKPAPGIANLVWGCLSKFSKVSTEPAHSLTSLCKPPVITPVTLLRALMVLLPLTGTLFHHGLGAPCWPHGQAGPTHSWWRVFFRGRSRGTQCLRDPPIPLPQHPRHCSMQGTEAVAILPPRPSCSYLLPKTAAQWARCQLLPPRSRTITRSVLSQPSRAKW